MWNCLRWMPQDFSDDKSTSVQVTAGCRQPTSHYMGQCWPGSISPYGVARTQFFNYASQFRSWKMGIWNQMPILMLPLCIQNIANIFRQFSLWLFKNMRKHDVWYRMEFGGISILDRNQWCWNAINQLVGTPTCAWFDVMKPGEIRIKPIQPLIASN